VRALTPAESWLLLILLFALIATAYLVGFAVGRQITEHRANRRAARAINRAMRTLGGRS